jgi:hypothetical protein
MRLPGGKVGRGGIGLKLMGMTFGRAALGGSSPKSPPVKARGGATEIGADGR